MVLDTSLLLIIFNTNVTVIVLAQSEIRQEFIIVLENKHLNYTEYPFAYALDKIRNEQIEKFLAISERQRS